MTQSLHDDDNINDNDDARAIAIPEVFSENSRSKNEFVQCQDFTSLENATSLGLNAHSVFRFFFSFLKDGIM